MIINSFNINKLMINKKPVSEKEISSSNLLKPTERDVFIKNTVSFNGSVTPIKSLRLRNLDEIEKAFALKGSKNKLGTLREMLEKNPDDPVLNEFFEVFSSDTLKIKALGDYFAYKLSQDGFETDYFTLISVIDDFNDNKRAVMLNNRSYVEGLLPYFTLEKEYLEEKGRDTLNDLNWEERYLEFFNANSDINPDKFAEIFIESIISEIKAVDPDYPEGLILVSISNALNEPGKFKHSKEYNIVLAKIHNLARNKYQGRKVSLHNYIIDNGL